jgi:hypothetical protein
VPLATFSKTLVEGGAPLFPLRGPLPAGGFSAQGRVALKLDGGPAGPCRVAVFGLVSSVSFGNGSSASPPPGWNSPTGPGWVALGVFQMAVGGLVYLLVPSGTIEVFATFVPPPPIGSANPELLVSPARLAAAMAQLAADQAAASRYAQRPPPRGVRYCDSATIARLAPQYPTLGLDAAQEEPANAPPPGTVTWSGTCYAALLSGTPQAGAYAFEVDQAPGS